MILNKNLLIPISLSPIIILLASTLAFYYFGLDIQFASGNWLLCAAFSALFPFAFNFDAKLSLETHLKFTAASLIAALIGYFATLFSSYYMLGGFISAFLFCVSVKLILPTNLMWLNIFRVSLTAALFFPICHSLLEIDRVNTTYTDTLFLYQITNAIWYLPLGILVGYEAYLCRNNSSAKLITLPNRIVWSITILPPLALISFANMQVYFNYKGKCYGFTDGEWSCSLAEYLINGIFGIGGTICFLIAATWISLLTPFIKFKSRKWYFIIPISAYATALLLIPMLGRLLHEFIMR